MKKTLLLVVSAFLLSSAGPVVARTQDVREAIVKIYTIHNRPDYYNPWSMQGPRGSTGSGCIIEGNKILSNAHVVSDQTFIQVRRHGEAKKYQARVIDVSHDADLAILTVDDPTFFTGVEPLEFGELPVSQDKVHVYGFPLGGDTLSTTEGVISRIEHQTYAHSSIHLLAGQIDAAINPGNSGGPVLKEDSIVGVVMQSMSQADNIGYMVPVTIIQHFLTDISDGKRDGFPSLGIVMQQMENPDMKRKYGMTRDQTGMLIVRTIYGSPADGQIQEGDIFLSVEGHDIADDGTVEFRPKERTSVSYFIQQHQIGEDLQLSILRDGKELDLTVNLGRPVQEDWLILLERYDITPTYYIYGGIVFCPLTKDLLQAWGSNWYNTAPKDLVNILSHNYIDGEIDEIVLALRVLAADVNEGYHMINNWVVESVDGQKIRNLKDLIRIVEGPSMGPYVIFSSEWGNQLVLDRQKAAETHVEIMQRYRIPKDRSDDLP
ncbi:MAG: trypsin-like peptidase domain-containing protein [Verrucomicrobia bacterium]|nr:trypsin-like peptidase domain-containing protein [Verrucomicrobiota bacterium]